VALTHPASAIHKNTTLLAILFIADERSDKPKHSQTIRLRATPAACPATGLRPIVGEFVRAFGEEML
jgi:hypothetical protein